MNAIYTKTIDGNEFELSWCSQCGRIQNKIG